MKKMIMNLFMVLNMVPLSSLATDYPVFTYNQKVEALEVAANRYTSLLRQFGQEEPGDLLPIMQTLFALDCKKIVNGKIVSTTPLEMYNQLSESRKNLGLWEVDFAGSMIIVPNRNGIALHYVVPTQKQGTIVVMKFIVCNEQGVIKEIHEVFNKSDVPTQTPVIGQRYIEFLKTLEGSNYIQELEALFSSSVKKVINSNVVCNNRDELHKQMRDVVDTGGVSKMNLLELIVSQDGKKNIVRFEITYGDNNTETVITILTCNNEGKIEEINEVFGAKHAYEWPA